MGYLGDVAWKSEPSDESRKVGPFSTPDLRITNPNHFNIRYAHCIAIISYKELSDKRYVVAFDYWRIERKDLHKRYTITLQDIKSGAFYTVGRGNKNQRAAWIKFCSLLGEAAYEGYIIDGIAKYFNELDYIPNFDEESIQFVP